MKTYILVDLANAFFRSRHVVRGNIDTQLGMALHITLASIKKAWTDFKADHVVICLEGRSWRKDFYKPYKANRAESRAAMSPSEAESDAMFWEVYEDFINFLKDKTNCTVLQNPELEGDDLIAGFIQMHPDDQHVIISTDKDFVQLIAPNVRQYDGVNEITITHEGYFDSKSKPVLDKKTKTPLAAPDPQWILFEKCIRGDTSDNVFSAYPGVRTKGTKNKVGLQEAYQDRTSKGWAWNNLMLQRWVDHNGEEHKVLTDYERNRVLIDLTAQPERIRKIIRTTIAQASVPKNITQVGIRLMKFCQIYDLKRISDQAQAYADPLNSRYGE